MAWVTRIVDMEQVEYRLSGNSGCYVQAETEGIAPPAADAQVDYRMQPADDTGLVWIGAGLPDAGLVAGTVLDEAGKDAARALANGVHPVTGERLVRAELRAHPRSQLAGARLVEAVEAAATAAGVEPEDLFRGKPKQQKKYETLARMVHQQGERHRLQVDSLHRLARAAGLDLADIYEAAELADARAHEDERVNVRVRAYDLVADLPKGDSVLWALLAEQREESFRELVHQAKREAFAQLEKWIGYGLASEDGKLQHIATGGLLGWTVEHQSARPVDDDTPGDPHLHVHIVIANLARCEDGQWRAIANGGMDLHRHARAFDALFKARVRALAGERFGVRYERDAATRSWNVVGIPEELREHYSRRAAQVEAAAGADASREEKQRVSTETRHAKHDTGTLDLRANWRQQAQDLGIDVDAMIAAAAPGPPGPDSGLAVGPGGGPQVPPPAQIAAEVFSPTRGLTAHEKTFSHAQLLAAVANACPHGLGDGELEGLADEVLKVQGYARTLPHRGSALMSNTNRYTTHDILAAEQVIVDQARARYADGSARLTDDQAAAALSVFQVAAGFALSAEQRRVVERLLTAGHGIDAVIGVAGSGKTTLMEACRIGWDAVGLTYAGACLSAVAAQNLYEGSGVPSSTIASWLGRIENGTGLRGVDVLVLDEAVMTDDRAMAVLLTEADRTGTKVIGIGDPQQLQAIGPGGGFEEVHRLVGGEFLADNRRQKNEGERAALEVWRQGAAQREKALRMLADNGRVHATDTADEARAEILAAWNQIRTRWPDAHEALASLVVLAARNDDVDSLNAGAQALRRTAGELGPARTFVLPRRETLTLAVGDVVRVRQNDYRSRRRGAGPDVLNGYRAVVTDISADRRVQITWRREEPDGTLSHQQAWLTPGQISQGALSLGYAMTIAASQGLTAQTSLMYGLGANAFSLYPGITRATGENHLWLPAAALEDEQTRAALGEPRSEAELLERALYAYGALLQQDRPAQMVSDQLRAAPDPVASPAPEPEPEFPAWDDAVARPYGAVSDALLDTKIAKAAQQATAAERAAADKARELESAAAELTAHVSPGRRIADEAAAVLAEADRLLALARQEMENADRAGNERDRARVMRQEAETAAGRNRITLLAAGTSRGEQEQLREQYTEQMAAAHEEQQRARQAAQAAQREAWQTVALSPYAGVFREQGATGAAPRELDEMKERLAAMREFLPALVQQVDTQRAEDVEHARGRESGLRARAETLRTTAAALRAERELRQQVAAEAQVQHQAEQGARQIARPSARRAEAAGAQQNRQGPDPVLRPDSPGQRVT
ncbi:relaxase domain-containing protein (plasmid) [Streptomyces sp. HU2014]|uniref:MobF family relaxase n=1 Tax=Streptomyces sp. HU2014 TaxID=2939414 RepID=UPI00200C4200|nr:MobF family relaxase [Streptomyces sp. HU2014]UQI49662.1 relaxase domain-containing protein [Streptomyces sp. HU2014]